MQTIDILKDIGKRCDGDIYLGVVAPGHSRISRWRPEPDAEVPEA